MRQPVRPGRGHQLRQAVLGTSPPVSESKSVDGKWHHIGVVWDGATRALYVNDVLVAGDSPSGIAGFLGGLNIGCGPNLEPGAFFSGLIDDVRIYNRAVKP